MVEDYSHKIIKLFYKSCAVFTKKEPVLIKLYFKSYNIPSWIAVNILTTAFFGIGTVMANYREKGILRRYQVTTVRPWMVLTAQTVQGTFIFTISAVIILIFGFLIFDLHVPKYLGSTLLEILLSLAAFFPFGLLINSIAKTVRTASAISSLALNLMIFLSGATFPKWSYHSLARSRCP
ncbi:hypothetical protein DCC39_18545 [Pueribacillus theae]|uniref:ABC-2 type transporter transmembrane domain-containing protein n=1 Tax=Pueribacillus theae TaxID=2171751 RepID=A0A2U1JI65_9BACI|nr:hypothetical protein DCC39_18545 [Pueribacillus theae]